MLVVECVRSMYLDVFDSRKFYINIILAIENIL